MVFIIQAIKAKDLTGQVFGKLTVVSRAENWRNKTGTCVFSVWHCNCECGKTTTVYGTRLTRGVTKSCGCIREEQHPDGAAFRRILSGYKNNAKKRELPFELTDEEFRKLVTAPCYYTGRLPHLTYKHNGNSFTYNGIDRLDSSKGYTSDNCVPCCFEVNRLKSDRTEQEFLELIKEIHLHVSKRNR